MKLLNAGVILMATMAGGCASTASTTQDVPKEEKEYVTGSNLPRRDRSIASEVKIVDPSAFEGARGSATANSGPKGN